MGKIIMNNLAFYGYHGVMKEENTLGQKFFFDIELMADIDKATISDNVEDTVHYGEAYETIKDIVENKRFMLIEKLAGKIAEELLEKFNKIQEVKVKVKKPEAPVPGIYDYFGVEIRKKRYE